MRLIAMLFALAALATTGCSSSCYEGGDCRGECVLPGFTADQCQSGPGQGEGALAECEPPCTPDGGCPDGTICVARCAVLSTGDNYDRVALQEEPVCLPPAETDGGT